MNLRFPSILPCFFSSAMTHAGLRAVTLVAAMGWLGIHTDAHARPSPQLSGISSAVERPIAPRGGVLLLPLQRSDDRIDWPRELALTLADGSVIRGQVAWMAAAREPRGNRTDTHPWTRDPRNLAVYRSQPTHTQRATPILLARLPAVGIEHQGPIRFGGQVLEPFWRDVPEPGVPRDVPRADAAAVGGAGVLERRRAADRPDVVSPFEYWRWVLLADRLGKRPPPPPGEDDATRMLAEYTAQLWLIGLDRVARNSPELAATAREMLTRTSKDRGKPFATWTSDVAATNELLDDLVNMRRTGESLVEHVSEWVQQHDRLILWSEHACMDQVTLAVVNPGLTSVVATFAWGGDLEEYPMAAEIKPHQLNRVTIDRPALGHGPRDGRPLPRPEEVPSTEQLTIEAGERAYQMIFERRFHAVEPPGMSLPPVHTPLTLYRAQTGATVDIAVERETFAHLRRIHGRWELFIECRRPTQAEGTSATEQDVPVDWTMLHTMRDFEGIVVIIGDCNSMDAQNGPDNDPEAVLVIPESGWYRLLKGEHDGTLQIHRSSRPDRWYARLVLPDGWLNTVPGEVTGIGILRFNHDLEDVHSAPYPLTPWRTAPGRISLDLSRWDDLPFPADVRRRE